jgi:hypothetical protein
VFEPGERLLLLAALQPLQRADVYFPVMMERLDDTCRLGRTTRGQSSLSYQSRTFTP